MLPVERNQESLVFLDVVWIGRIQEHAGPVFVDDRAQATQVIRMPVGEKHQVQHAYTVSVQKRNHRVAGLRQAAVDEDCLASRRRDQCGIALTHVQKVDLQAPGWLRPLGSRAPTARQPCQRQESRQRQPRKAKLGPEAAMTGHLRRVIPRTRGRQKTARPACLSCRTGPRKGACRCTLPWSLTRGWWAVFGLKLHASAVNTRKQH